MRSRVFLLLTLAGFAVARDLPAQTTCSQPMVLRQETCPAGATTCSTKTSDPLDSLSWLELDRWAINVIDACNGPMKFNWGVTPSSGFLRSDGSGVISIAAASGVGACGAGQFVSATNNNAAPTCGTPAGGGGSSIVLDLADNGANESTGITEIATTGDTNSIFTEPAADKLLINVGLPWPTASALAANPANCSAGQWAAGGSATGVAEGCTADDDNPDSDSEVPNAITIAAGTIGANTLTGVVKTAGLTVEPGQASLGFSPHWLGIADGSLASPITDVEPSFAMQRWDVIGGGATSMGATFYCNHTQGSGYHYCADAWARDNSRTSNDVTALDGRVIKEPFGLVQNPVATPSSSGGTLATAVYAYYVSAIVSSEEILGSQHVTASVTGPTGSVGLTWTALSGAASYRIYRYVPASPEIYPVFFTSAGTSFTDTGAAGTSGIGLSSTGWGIWAQARKTAHSSRLAGIETGAVNDSGMDAPFRADVVGSTMGLQVVAGGANKSSIGIHVTGTPSTFRRGLVMDAGSFDQYGIDLRESLAAAPGLRLANTQSLVARNAANTADVTLLRADASNLVQLGGGASTIDPTNLRLGIVTTSPDERLEIEESANASTIGLVQNTSTGSSAIAIWRAESDGAIVGMQAHGSGRVTSRFGVTVANYGEILQTTGNGLLVGTSTSVPLIFGTASAQRMTINADGSIDIPQMTVPSNPASGTRRLFVDSSTGEMSVRTSAGSTVSLEAGGGGGGGAPADPTYLTLGANGTLTNERVFTPGLGLTSTDGGAGGALTLAFLTTDTLAGNPAYSSEDVVFTKDGTGGGLLFEGSGADAVEGILIWNPTTSDKTLILPDVTGSVITTGDTGTVTSTMILNDGVTEADLKAVDAAVDEECLTYESTVGDFEWQACGSGSAPALPRVRGRISVDQSIPNATETAIAFDVEDVDQGTFHDTATNNTRFTVPSGEGGTYIANCSMLIQQGTNERILRMRKNGTTIVAEHKDGGIGNTSINMGMDTTAVLELNATDYIECLAYHAHGTAIVVRADERTHATLTKMR